MANNINQDNFNKLLNWLGATSQEGAEEYEHIRRVLIKIFLARGFSDAEDLTDETIDRVASKIDEIEAVYTGRKILYFGCIHIIRV
jgi:chemotaxis regulatin CheY-phosphate phosphatase CheZ